MLSNIKELSRHKLAASDGDIGHVKDFYFDDQTWAIRYLVADTGSWLTGRLVLLSPHAFGRLDRHEKLWHINLSRKQIENSPAIDSHRPVSRQHEEEYFNYYGWPNYWQGGGIWGLADYPAVTPPSNLESPRHHGHNQRDDLHLRSTNAVTGYHLQAADGEIGHVSGFMVDDKSWVIGELAVETGHWYSGKEVLIRTGKIDRISYDDSMVFVNLTRADIQRTADNNLVKAGG